MTYECKIHRSESIVVRDASSSGTRAEDEHRHDFRVVLEGSTVEKKEIHQCEGQQLVSQIEYAEKCLIQSRI